jgi:hypothetical protein
MTEHAARSTSAKLPPGDAEIRAALLAHLRNRHAGNTDTAFLEELGLCRGQVRIDVAVVNCTFHGYEIKSDRDSLRRLAGQIDLYGRVLDRASLVIGGKHVDHAIASVPSWWAIQTVDLGADGIRLTRVRAGRRNPCRDARALVELLWLDASRDLLEARDAMTAYRRMPRRAVWDRICELFGVGEIARAVRTHLKSRKPTAARPPRP